MHQVAEDFRESCVGSTSYLISMSLVLLSLAVSELTKFFCHLPTYIWGVFFLYWLYSLFNVVQSLAVRRFVGTNGDFSKKMVISESVKILRLTTLLIIALIIYSSALGNSATLKYSVLGVIGLAIALGFVPSFHNVVGGLFLAFNSQFKIDDFIRVGDAEGFVHRVSLRYTTVVSLEGTTLYVPNSFFLYKPMINFSQRPKRDVDLHIRVSRATPVETLRQAIRRLESMLQSLHVGLTSHEENQSDLRHGEKWERFFFVAMEELYTLRVYSYTEELDARKYAMLKSEVWLAVTEIMEDLGIRVLSNDDPDNPYAESPHFFKRSASNMSHADDEGVGDPFTSEIGAVVGAQPSSNGVKGPLTQL
ncbi:putative MscS family protein [Phytophthora citrophthora]|uniref:MscS family protein n=1 Tax=Phytophthora citrophthora TaxID=4793 RepID=A0AAD9GPI2_9STRA|nr:putative MscS family protein [Phytophthora citrophthora]